LTAAEQIEISSSRAYRNLIETCMLLKIWWPFSPYFGTQITRILIFLNFRPFYISNKRAYM